MTSTSITKICKFYISDKILDGNGILMVHYFHKQTYFILQTDIFIVVGVDLLNKKKFY